MTYTEILTFLYNQLPMYQREGTSAFKKDLTNINALLKVLGEPQTSFKSVHIAGTNGKGTTAHMIAAGIQANGYKVGIYSSPHYKDFRERIKINGELAEQEFIADFVISNMDHILKINPSFFEITVAMAFAYFKYKKVDIAVIETGLGGRLDSTNVILPILSVITNISYDHQSMLGNTLPEIAAEKAGIIKYSIPTVVGELQPEIQEIFDKKALKANSSLRVAEEESNLEIKDENLTFSVNDDYILTDIKLKVRPKFLLKNLNTALFSLYRLHNQLELDSEKIVEGINNFADITYYIGRYQKLNNAPLTIADSAHNKAGVISLLEALETENYNNLHVVIGFVNDKDISEIIDLLPKEGHYYLAKANIPRGLDVEALSEMMYEKGYHYSKFSSVENAYLEAQKKADRNDLILICGSIFVVAEVL